MNEVKKIGRYEVTSEIGRGGMGVVYLAIDPLIGRDVALKMLILEGFTEAQAKEIKERFQREAMAAGRLQDPNIVTVYDVGEQDGESFLAMEYVQGRSLEDILDEDALLSLPRVLEIVEGIAAALDHAHSQGIVHRDIKPANILLPHKGGVRVTDFGIARIENLRITREGAMLGSPSYMSPEQILGREIDGRSDVFSLGVILYILLTGEKPFPGESLATLTYRIVQENPTPPSQLTPGLNPAYDAVLGKALAKDPAQRYATAGELARDLRALVSMSLTDSGSTVVVKTMPSSHPVTGPGGSYPSITAIPLPDAGMSGIHGVGAVREPPLPMPSMQTTAVITGRRGGSRTAPTNASEMPKSEPRFSPRFYIAGAITLLVLAIGSFVVWSSHRQEGNGNGGLISPANASESKNYNPLGIVPRQYVLWRDANAALGNQDYKSAMEMLKELEMLAPADAQVQLAMGNANFNLKHEREAFENDRRALQLDPQLSKDPQLIAQLIKALGDRDTQREATDTIVQFVGDAAEKQLMEAAASQNNPTLSRNALAALIALWQKRLAAIPGDVDTRLMLAHAYYRTGEYLNSIDEYRQALQDRPDENKNPELILNLVEMLDGPSNQTGKAIDVLGHQVGSPAVPALKKITPERGRKMQENATTALDIILQQQVIGDTSNAQAALDLAFQYAARKDYTTAYNYLSTAIKRDSNHGKDPKVIALLMGGLKFTDPGAAVEILGRQVGEPALPQVKQALQSTDYNLRWNAVAVMKAMGKANEVDITAILISDLLAPDSTCAIRRNAFKQLETSTDPRAAGAIAKALDDPKAKRCIKKADEPSSGAPPSARKPKPTPTPAPAPASPPPKKKKTIRDLLHRNR